MRLVVCWTVYYVFGLLLVLLGVFGVTRVLVTSLKVLSIDTCVLSVEPCAHALSPVRFDPVSLDLMSHIVSPAWLNQLSHITARNWFRDSRVSTGVRMCFHACF